MKIFKRVVFLLLAFFAMGALNAQAEEIEPTTAEVDEMLQEKLDELFPTGEITIDVADTYAKESYENLPANIKSEMTYENYIKGGILELIALYNEEFFGEDIKIDTGIEFDGKKIYATGGFEYSMECDTTAAYSYTVYSGCVEGGGCGTSGGGASKNLSVKLNIIETEESTKLLLKNYREQMKTIKVLKYDDLSWINMLLSTDLKGILSDRFVKDKAAKYLFAPITKLNPDTQIIIDNRLGTLSVVTENPDNIEWDDSNLLEVVFSGELPAFYKGILHDNYADTRFYVYYGNVIYIPDTTTSENYISVAEQRIKEYLNNSDYEIAVTKTDYNVFDNFSGAFDDDFLPEDLETGIFDVFNLNIKYKENSYDFKFIMKKVPAADIKVPVTNYLEEENKILMQTTSSDVPANSIIVVNKIEKNSEQQKTIEDVLNTDNVTAYDITLESAYGIIREVHNGVVTIKIPIPEGYAEEKSNIFYVSDDGLIVEQFNRSIEEINGVKYFAFFTNHFSTYVVAAPSSINNPETSDSISTYVLIGAISIIGLLSTCIVTKKSY